MCDHRCACARRRVAPPGATTLRRPGHRRPRTRPTRARWRAACVPPQARREYRCDAVRVRRRARSGVRPRLRWACHGTSVQRRVGSLRTRIAHVGDDVAHRISSECVRRSLYVAPSARTRCARTCVESAQLLRPDANRARQRCALACVTGASEGGMVWTRTRRQVQVCKHTGASRRRCLRFTSEVCCDE